jgi:hypothetical protein
VRERGNKGVILINSSKMLLFGGQFRTFEDGIRETIQNAMPGHERVKKEIEYYTST